MEVFDIRVVEAGPKAKSSVVDFIFYDGLIPHALLPRLHQKMGSVSPLR